MTTKNEKTALKEALKEYYNEQQLSAEQVDALARLQNETKPILVDLVPSKGQQGMPRKNWMLLAAVLLFAIASTAGYFGLLRSTDRNPVGEVDDGELSQNEGKLRVSKRNNRSKMVPIAQVPNDDEKEQPGKTEPKNTGDKKPVLVIGTEPSRTQVTTTKRPQTGRRKAKWRGRRRKGKRRVIVHNPGYVKTPSVDLLLDVTVDNDGQRKFNVEQYDRIYENEFVRVTEKPLSTFSIDVDTASYANVRRFLTAGRMPYKGAVRIEELINYFSYDYPQPKDDHPFSITTEVTQNPWNTKHRLVLIGLQGKKVKTANLPPTNLVFLIDVSGSMSSRNKLPLLKSAFKLLVQNLREKDRVAIVVYAGAAGLVLPSTPGHQKAKIIAAIDRLQSGGSTAGGAGIKLAYSVAKTNFMPNGNNRVILATDGDFNVGVSNNSELVRMIEQKRKSGVFLTVLGFGMGNYKDSRLEKLADKGNGNYAYIDTLKEANKVFVKEIGGTLFAIAKDVKLQIEFNPSKVQAYRLIGYENRKLKKEDFNNDKKDAGELGAGHSVTALYEVIPVGVKANLPKVDPLKYQKTKVTKSAKTSSELFTVKFRYKRPKESKSILLTRVVKDSDRELKRASTNIRFAAAVAQFGALLRDSKFKGSTTYDAVLEIAQTALGKDSEGYRAEFLRLVRRARTLSKRK